MALLQLMNEYKWRAVVLELIKGNARIDFLDKRIFHIWSKDDMKSDAQEKIFTLERQQMQGGFMCHKSNNDKIHI